MKIVTVVCVKGHSFCIGENDLYGFGDNSIECRGLVGRDMQTCGERFTGNKILKDARGGDLVDYREVK